MLYNYSQILATLVLWAKDNPNTTVILNVLRNRKDHNPEGNLEPVATFSVSATYKGLLTFETRGKLENLRAKLAPYYKDGINVSFLEVN